jgi:hypothetical protein
MNVEELKAFIDLRITGLEKRVDERFDDVAERVDGLTVQVRETNGRVREHERVLPGHGARILAAERDVKRLADARQVKSDAGENRKLTKWDALLVMGAVGVTVATLKLIGLLK